MASSSACCSSTTADCDIQEVKSLKVVLGLQCLKTPALLRSLEMAATATTMGGRTKSSRDDDINDVGSHQYQLMSEKIKASNFPIATICIGSWKRVSRKEGELTAKLYFAKRKLIWEFLDGQLKSKMEVSWSDIISLKASMLPNQDGVLQIELGNPPMFFRELTPQPRKHTNWQQATDFTDGQAPLYRRHYVTFPPGALDSHYNKLLQRDRNLYELSKRPFPSHESPFFNTALPLQINILSNTTTALQQHQQQQQQQQQSRFHHHQYYSPSSMASPLYLTSLNPSIITQGYNVRDEGAILNNLSHMEERKWSEARAAMWGNQTTYLDSSLMDKQQQQEWDPYCEYEGSSLEYPPPPPLPFNYENHVSHEANDIINMYDLQSSGGGGGLLSAADEEELRKINEDERYKWLIPHILGTSNSNSNNGIGIASTNQINNLYPYPPADPTSSTNSSDHVQGFADMPPYL